MTEILLSLVILGAVFFVVAVIVEGVQPRHRMEIRHSDMVARDGIVVALCERCETVKPLSELRADKTLGGFVCRGGCEMQDAG